MERPQTKINNELLNLIIEEGNYFEFNHAGFKCFIQRAALDQKILREQGIGLIHWCGYISTGFDISPVMKSTVLVHGGITYNNDGLIGFDCAHANDLCTVIAQKCPQSLYRSKEYVIDETKRLADQLRKVALPCRLYTIVRKIFG
jgi:hypothetical protein